MRALFAAFMAVMFGLTFALPASANGLGEIESIAPSSPVWGDTVLVDVDARVPVDVLVICRHEDTPYPGVISFWGRFPASGGATFTLTPNGDPVPSNCRMTLNRTDAHRTLDVFDFSVS